MNEAPTPLSAGKSLNIYMNGMLVDMLIIHYKSLSVSEITDHFIKIVYENNTDFCSGKYGAVIDKLELWDTFVEEGFFVKTEETYCLTEKGIELGRDLTNLDKL